MIKCPSFKFAKMYSERTNKANIYLYELTYGVTSKSLLKGILFDFVESTFGVIHGMELFFVFGLPLIEPQEYQQNDIKLSKEIMKHWTDFAKYGYSLNYRLFHK